MDERMPRRRRAPDRPHVVEGLPEAAWSVFVLTVFAAGYGPDSPVFAQSPVVGFCCIATGALIVWWALRCSLSRAVRVHGYPVKVTVFCGAVAGALAVADGPWMRIGVVVATVLHCSWVNEWWLRRRPISLGMK
ncbi:hypothetical protein SAMN05421595_2110 [Austwickia chelonae]|uniref:Uncharacterized protein n=1 Tax=Austwickia chelonae NBRC 105200 TaxID=1184607 RepID=K6VNL7_9MICO|nr:hypothetical protein [Austwickia chelonae]GAB76975.1 hypothetical protein AUCHE_04_00150 [Austwickia chelonae NBRC 105200]SEW32906.1 hypothetical protein SAMN05421595_2110 [Austwickia chelonae]